MSGARHKDFATRYLNEWNSSGFGNTEEIARRKNRGRLRTAPEGYPSIL